MHGLLKYIVKKQRVHEFIFIRDIPKLNKNCIYAVNHTCKWDFQYMVEIISDSFYVLAGKQRLNFVDRIGFIWNGVVWVDRKDKVSKEESKKKLNKLIQKGNSICIFPEGTWNLTPEKPILPLYWGIIELAQNNNIPIVPICFEYRNNICYVKPGEVFYVEKEGDKQVEIDKLRDILATLRWEIWEIFPREIRRDIPNHYWTNYIEERLAEYKKLDYEYEISCIRG